MTVANSARPILLVDDSVADRFLTIRALKKHRLRNPIIELKDGDAAVDYIFQRGEYEGAARPLLVLLDLHMPGIDGHEVLNQIKTNPDTRSIPVVMLTSSKDQADVAAAYNKYANAYIVKPVGLQNMIEVMATLGDFWLEIVQRPDS